MDKLPDKILKDFLVGIPQSKHSLSMITVYRHPDDYKDKYVARLYIVEKGVTKCTTAIVLADTLDEIRTKIPSHLFRMPRSENDLESVVESYL